jgi:hypothetical protein
MNQPPTEGNIADEPGCEEYCGFGDGFGSPVSDVNVFLSLFPFPPYLSLRHLQKTW